MSDRAQRVLGMLVGETLSDTSGALGGGDWTIQGFAVVPNPVSRSGKGPVVLLEHDAEQRHLPMEADGDAADLYQRVRGVPAAGLSVETSAAYRRVMGI